MSYTLDEFQKKFKIYYKTMDIEEGVSIYPRTIFVPKCPECGGNLFLYHPEMKMDPFISIKFKTGILRDKIPGGPEWVAACWTDNCEFYYEFDEAELARCPVCGRYALELYSLYDHMRFQCTRKAREIEVLKKAGVEMYIGDLM